MYSCVDYYFDRSDYDLLGHDTDSLYVAFTSECLDDIIKPGLLRHFYENRSKWFPAEACEDHEREYIEHKVNRKPWLGYNNPCCEKKRLYQKREVLLFKVENVCTEWIALNSKTYFCYNENDGSCKYSSKGLSKKNNLTKEQFLNVLKTKQPDYGVNKGFVLSNNKIYTYSQKRAGLVYLYIKRIVSKDGSSTSPLLV